MQLDQHLQELDLSEGLIKFLPHLLAGFLLIQLVLQPDLYLKRAQEYLESFFLLHVFTLFAFVWVLLLCSRLLSVL